MSERNNGFSCAINCGAMGALAGLVFAAVFYIVADYSATQAIFAGVVIAGAVALLLGVMLCGKSGAGQSRAPTAAPHPTPAKAQTAAAPAAKAESAAATAPAAPAAASAPTASGFQMQPSKALPGQADLAARKGDWKYENQAASAAPAALVSQMPAEKPAPKAKKATATPKAEAKADAKATAKPKRPAVAADGKPEMFDAPGQGGADDLKLISGVGPKLEQTLNEMGVWHFSQVAGWRKKEIAWVDERLKFKGRIERDDWISQAKILAKGGETEFSKRKKK